MNYFNFVFGAIFTTCASIATAADNSTGSSSAPIVGNAAVVESDHGQGLGPNGADLHVNSRAESRDAEVLQNSLQNLPELQVEPPLNIEAQPVKGELDGKSDTTEIETTEIERE